MEISVGGELLPDQRGTDHLAVLLDQASLRLIGKDRSGDAGHDQGIDKPGDHGERDDEHERGADFFQHDVSSSLGEVQGGDQDVDHLDADKGNDDAAEPIDQQIAPEQRTRADGPIGDALQGKRNERDDDQRIEDDRRQDGALRRRQIHNVERLELRVEGEEQRRDDGEIFRHVVGDGERRQRAARHQQLLADLHDLDELGRIGVEIDHVAGFARGLGAGIHGDADIGLRQSRRIVGAVAAHGDELALGLLGADQLELLLGRCLREEIIDAGFSRDCRSGHGVVAGDHDGADAHAAELGEALADAAFDDVLELDDAEQLAVLGHRKRRASGLGDPLGDGVDLPLELGADRGLARGGGAATDRLRRLEVIDHRVDRALADPRAVDLDTAHPALRGERDELGAELVNVAAADAVFLLGQHHDRAAFGRLVGERSELCCVRQLLLAHAAHGHEGCRLPVAEGDGAGLVEQERIDVAGRLDGAA